MQLNNQTLCMKFHTRICILDNDIFYHFADDVGELFEQLQVMAPGNLDGHFSHSLHESFWNRLFQQRPLSQHRVDPREKALLYAGTIELAHAPDVVRGESPLVRKLGAQVGGEAFDDGFAPALDGLFSTMLRLRSQ